jgi:5-methylcytosine-specific restriction endonuclease McrA
VASWQKERGTRQERGYGAAWQRIRKLAIARDRGLCQTCLAKSKVTPFDEVDHIKPKAQGGTDNLDNLQCICKPCHAVKTSAEGAQAKGYRVRKTIGADGWPQ